MNDERCTHEYPEGHHLRDKRTRCGLYATRRNMAGEPRCGHHCRPEPVDAAHERDTTVLVLGHVVDTSETMVEVDFGTPSAVWVPRARLRPTDPQPTKG